MLSRVAESIYWMGRQIERAENLARFLEVTLSFDLDQPENVVDPWVPLISVSGDEEEFNKRFSVCNADTVTRFLAFDIDYPNSMLASLKMARQNARGVRECMSSESFELLNDFYHFVSNAAQDQNTKIGSDFFAAVREHALLFNGVFDGTMPRDLAWNFSNLGRMIERADKTSRILDVKYFNLLPTVSDVGTAIDDLQWSSLLLAISGFEAYRRQHHMIQIPKVVEFFLFNPKFPRSVSYCVQQADHSLREVLDRPIDQLPGPAEHVSSALVHRLNHTGVKEVLAGGMHQFVDQLQRELNQLGDAISQELFHAQPA